MATKAQLQEALNNALERISVLEAQVQASKVKTPVKASLLPWDDAPVTRREVMAAARQQAMATGRVVRAA